MGRADVGQNGESSSGSRLTRSHLQAGPVWTVQDMLILVNEIAAVEVDCQDALSSYQKWSIIAENCTALDVVRNVNQCRRKWESLLSDFNAIKKWESSSGRNSYWSLERERRQETGLPLDFDEDLYTAIDVFTKATDQAITDTECDSEAEAEAAEVDVLNAGTSDLSGSKPKRGINRSTPRKNRTIGRKQLAKVAIKEEREKPVPIVKDIEQIMAPKVEGNMKTGRKPKRVKLESTFQRPVSSVRKQLLPDEEHEKPVPVIEDAEQILATKVKEKTELIHSILAGIDNIENEETSSVREDEILKTERVQYTADKLIACLTDLAKNLEQLCDVVKEC